MLFLAQRFNDFYFNFLIPLVIDTTGSTPAADVVDDVADAATPSSFWDILPTILLWGGMLVALYFFLIRPQRKRDKQQTAMQQSIKVGDRVLTSSGFYGKIVDIGNDAFVLEFGDNRGVRVPVRKSDVIGLKTPDMSPVNRSDVKEIEDKDEKKDKKDEKSDYK